MRRTAAGVLAVLLIAGCAASPTDQPGPTGATATVSAGPVEARELRIARPLSPRVPTMDPMLTSGADPEYENLFEGLTTSDPQGEVVPALATEWTTTAPTTWRFTLREGVEFRNGDPFTAEDVKYSFDRIRDPANESPLVPFLAVIEDIVVVNPHTVDVITTIPYAALPLDIGQRLKVVPSGLVAELGNEAFATKPVGTGGYKFVEWIVDQRVVHEANQDYWRGAPPIQKVTYLNVPEASTRIAMLLNDEADLIQDVLDTDLPRIEENPGLKIIQSPSMYTHFISMNSFREPFDDVRVRQAVNLAVDADGIIKDVVGAGSRVNITLCSLCFGYDNSIEPYPYDPEKAKRLLAEAGYDGTNFPPQRITVGRNRQPYNAEVSEAVASYLTAVGIPTTINVIEANAQFEEYVSGEAGIIYHAINGLGDAGFVLGLNFHSKQRGLYYNSAELDAKLDAAVGQLDVAERSRLYSEISQMVFDAAPHLFLYDQTDLFAARADLDFMPLPNRNMVMWTAHYK